MVSADSHTMVAKGMYYGYQQWYVSPYTMVLCMVCYGTVYVYDGWYAMDGTLWYVYVRGNGTREQAYTNPAYLQVHQWQWYVQWYVRTHCVNC